MAGTINKAILIGHLGDEVKMTHFDENSCVGRFPIATNESYTNRQTGERVTTTEWHNIVVRNNLAKTCEKYLSKGDKVYCEGRIKTRQWEQDGQKRYTTEIIVVNMTFLSTRKETANPAQNPAQSTQQAPVSQPKSVSPEEDDDLPF